MAYNILLFWTYHDQGIQGRSSFAGLVEIDQNATLRLDIAYYGNPGSYIGGRARPQEDLVVMHRRRLAAGHRAAQQRARYAPWLLESAQSADECPAPTRPCLEFQVSRGPVSQDGLFDEESGAAQSRRYTDGAGEQELSPVLP